MKSTYLLPGTDFHLSDANYEPVRTCAVRRYAGEAEHAPERCESCPLTDGWTFLGRGASRFAFLLPDGKVLKLQYDTPYDGTQCDTEVENYEATPAEVRNRLLPVLYAGDQGFTVCDYVPFTRYQEPIDPEDPYEYLPHPGRVEHPTPWRLRSSRYEIWEQIRKQIQSTVQGLGCARLGNDLHTYNIGVTAEGRPVILDWA